MSEIWLPSVKNCLPCIFRKKKSAHICPLKLLADERTSMNFKFVAPFTTEYQITGKLGSWL